MDIARFVQKLAFVTAGLIAASFLLAFAAEAPFSPVEDLHAARAGGAFYGLIF